MASKPQKPCSKHGCPNLTRAKYCEEHAGLAARPVTWDKDKAKEYDKQRGTAASRGYDSKWRTYRTKYLKLNPYCKQCGQPATVVDHVIPHKGNKGLFWTSFNHQALCKRCHDVKTATHDGGLGNRLQ